MQTIVLKQYTNRDLTYVEHTKDRWIIIDILNLISQVVWNYKFFISSTQNDLGSLLDLVTA